MTYIEMQVLKLGQMVWEMISRTMNAGNPKDGAYALRTITFPTSDGLDGKVTLIVCRDQEMVTAFEVAAAQKYSRVDTLKVDNQ